MRIEYLVSTIVLLFLYSWLFFPFIYSIYISFFEYVLTRPDVFRFVGIKNYVQLFNDHMFYTSLTITFTYAVIALTIEFLLGLGIALFLSKDMYGVGIMRIVVGIPILLVPAATTILWKALSSKTYGIFDLITSYLGLGSLGWWDDPVLSSILVILVDVWQWTPFVAIVLLAAILSLPKEPYEAAKVDGLSTYTVFTKITLPMLRPTIMIILILRFLDLLKLLEPVLLITKGSYPTLSMYVWRYVFKSLNIGFGGAFSTIYWLIAWILATILLRIFLKYRI